MRAGKLIICALGVALVSAPLFADTIFTTALTGAAETPPVSTPASGEASAVLSSDWSTLLVSFSFVNLITNAVAAHIHCCAPPGDPAGVAIPLPIDMATFGAESAVFNLTLASTYDPAFLDANGGTAAGAQEAFVSALLGGLTYINVHSSTHPTGEIRGQLIAVPEPTTLALVSAGIAGLALRRRKQCA